MQTTSLKRNDDAFAENADETHELPEFDKRLISEENTKVVSFANTIDA